MSKTKTLVAFCRIMLGVLVLVSAQADIKLKNMSPQLSTSPEYYFARYRINGSRPDEFAEVAYLVLGVSHSPSNAKGEPENVKYDEQGNALIKGEVWTENGISYPFETAKLTRSTTLRRDGCGLFTQLTALTQPKGGISYHFEGHFLEEPEEVKKGGLISFVSLVGVLEKMRDGQKIVSAQVPFSKLRIE